MGADGHRFMILKFRTMWKDAEKMTGPVFSTPDDPRQTPIGRFLRQMHLDELPQLINVFRGDMSLVGPRPERPHFVEQFREEIPGYMARHRIKSGITGWAQVSGPDRMGKFHFGTFEVRSLLYRKLVAVVRPQGFVPDHRLAFPPFAPDGNPSRRSSQLAQTA